MKKPLVTLIVSLGLGTFSYSQSLPTNWGGTIAVTNMAGFDGTYSYRDSVPIGTNFASIGYPAGTRLHRFDYPDGTGRVVMVVLSEGASPKIARVYRDSGLDNIVFDINGNIVEQHPSSAFTLAGEGLNVLNGTLPNFMLTWSGGGAGPGYTKMVNARAKARELAERLNFQNGRWSPQ